jgi:hypothetical protein
MVYKIPMVSAINNFDILMVYKIQTDDTINKKQENNRLKYLNLKCPKLLQDSNGLKDSNGHHDK